MQRLTKNIFIWTFLALITTATKGESNLIESQFLTADSLYQNKILKKCIEIYEGELNNNLTFSEASLVQMASIYFASNDTSKSIQTLEILHKHYPDNLYLDKLNELKIKNSNFINTNKWLQSLSYYNKYSRAIKYSIFTLSCVSSLLWIGLLFFGNRNKKSLLITSVVFILITIVLNNINTYRVYSLPKSKTCFVRTEPSNAAPVLIKTKNFQKFEVLDFKDIWIKVKVEDSYGFIKKDHLLFII